MTGHVRPHLGGHIIRVRVFGCPFKWLQPAHKWTGLRRRLEL